MSRKKMVAILASLSLLFGITTPKIFAQEAHEQHPITTVQRDQFQAIEQPLGRKIVVTLLGLGLMSLELWWFLFSKSKSQ